MVRRLLSCLTKCIKWMRARERNRDYFADMCCNCYNETMQLVGVLQLAITANQKLNEAHRNKEWIWTDKVTRHAIPMLKAFNTMLVGASALHRWTLETNRCRHTSCSSSDELFIAIFRSFFILLSSQTNERMNKINSLKWH